jgi:hypothetical protein
MIIYGCPIRKTPCHTTKQGGNLIRKKETPEIDVQIPYVMKFHDISWGIFQFLSPLLPWCFWTMMRMTRIKPWSLGGMGSDKGL